MVYEKIKQDDSDLIEFFEFLEIILSKKGKSKAEKDWTNMLDFKVFSEYFVKDIEEMQLELKNPSEEYLYYVCQHLFNVLDWIKLMVEDAGFLTFSSAWEKLFSEHFGDKQLLQNMYDACFEKWISGKSGQYQIGENFYNILDGKVYYRDRFEKWFEVDHRTAFDLKPNQKPLEDVEKIGELNKDYKETWYHAFLKRWENQQYKGKLEKDFLGFKKEETSPEEYFDFSIEQAKDLIKNPISVAELERWNGGDIKDLENMVKVATFVLNLTSKRRGDDSQTIYLLRDCQMFYEIHKTLDTIYGEDTSGDQILVGRKLLSHKPGEWGYYGGIMDAIYTAHLRFPVGFPDFYNEFARLMDLFVSVNPKFAAIVSEIADYIRNHIDPKQEKIVIFDIGFQGSIALLAKYIIDKHIKPSGPQGNVETDIEIGVGALWSKKLFGHRHDSDYFPMLNRVQLMARSDELYHYKDGSLKSGNIRVVMGGKENQRQAAIELVVLVMVALLNK